MNLRALFRPTAYYDLALERSWLKTEPYACPHPPSWPLDIEKLRECRIVWPTKYQWPQAAKWMAPILTGLRKYVQIEYQDIPQSNEKVVLAELHYHGEAQTLAIDYADDPRVAPSVVDRSAVYFKMQFHKDGYSQDHVRPGGFVTNDCSIYRYIPHLRELAKLEPEFDVYGRFTLRYGKQIREKALHLLSSQQRFEFKGGPRRVRYSRFLRQSARSSICIDLPGEGIFCFRLIDYLAVGSCIVAARHSAVFPEPLVDRKHIVFVKPDLSDLREICIEYLRDEETRRTIAHNAQDYFNRYLHREQLAAYYLHESLAML